MTKKRSLLDMANTMKVGAAQPAVVIEEKKAPASTEKEATSTAQGAVKPIKEMDKADLTAMHIRLPKATHRRLKLQNIEEERPMNDIIVEAIEAYLRRSSGPARKR
ncbi:hypothetical protein [Oceaniovalibus sp. ACAM 378]|uniref:hypothetical protein n=1 Tax=Oceaniovalibus sp. ACAM 378 TaxID=2599923 RepID=UPI0011D5A616|nr:hypothetical protein [Oceaniovalibus sp. ACAM 378]TYB83733.1 hypothetical protein FQ320_24090 [Oceaniovalibus sp. ACAM 378]